MAAMACNWLHNGKATNREAFLSGSYDVATFGYVAGIFTDQLQHSPGARYWIPTFDEMLKASHYDPDRNGQEQGGWWLYNNSSDTAPVGGPPGVGDGNFNWAGPGGSQFTVPLGSYPQTQSPWGLLDLAEGTREWTEGVWESPVTGTRQRFIDGTYWSGPSASNAIYGYGSEFPNVSTLDLGFRVASSVPSASSYVIFCGCVLPAFRRKTRPQGVAPCSVLQSCLLPLREF